MEIVTYVRVQQEFVYLAVVLDACTAAISSFAVLLSLRKCSTGQCLSFGVHSSSPERRSQSPRMARPGVGDRGFPEVRQVSSLSIVASRSEMLCGNFRCRSRQGIPESVVAPYATSAIVRSTRERRAFPPESQVSLCPSPVVLLAPAGPQE
jgi:hypothetical protein